ncbi:MAG: response regulator receiver protein [Pedosphaera sp.]|nr:response regulator receiver protein [Pedosphaera sp.]
MNIGDKTVDILLVEDSEEDAELAMEALKARNLGNKVMHFLDGEQVLDFLCAGSWSADWNPESAPKVILLDLNLTGMNGLEVLHQLKVRERTRPIPVVVLTGSLEEKEMLESYRLGVNSFVVKPADPKQYARLIGDIVHYWLAVNRPFQVR